MHRIFERRDRKPKNQAAGSTSALNQEFQTNDSSTSRATLTQINISQPGLVEFKAPGTFNPTLDVVFVHGLNGNGGRTWTHQETGFWWPEQLGRDLPHARILIFNYDTFFEPASKGTNLVRIPDIARNLCHQLAGNRFDHGIEEGTRPIVMIGHSLGGLVIEKALVECNEDPFNGLEDILKSTISIILFGTPNAGSLANEKKRVQIFKWICERAGYEIPPRIFEALKNHSPELVDLSKSFQKLKIWDTPWGETPFMRTYHENRTQDRLGIQVVDETSAKVGVRGEVTLGVQTDHNQMVRFRDGNDSIYKSVRTSVNMAMSKSKPEPTHHEHIQDSFVPCPEDSLRRRLPYGTASIENGFPSDRERQKAKPTDEGDDLDTSESRDDQIDYVDRPVPRKERNFMGQQEHLKNIDEKFGSLFQPGPKEPHSVGLLGLGGVGKTQLALKYFHDATSRQDNPFTTAFWIDSSSEGALQTAISRIWALLQPPKTRPMGMQTTAPHKVVFSQILNTLEKWTRPYLIIFDNANSQGVLDYIPRNGPAAVIITTRLMRAADALDSPIWIRGLAVNTATSLLLRLLECDSTGKDKHEEITGEAEAIVRRLGTLPLAIHAAASYIKRQHLTDHLSQFLPEYEKQKVYMLRQPPHSWGSSDDNQNVFKTWELSLQVLGTDEEDRRRKAHFLSVFSFLSPHRISCVHFEQHFRRRSSENCVWCSAHDDWMKIFSSSKGEFDRTRFREVITEFEALSLVESCSVDASGLVSFSLHPLVRDWAMIRHGCCDRQAHFAEALVCLAATLKACNFVDGRVEPRYLFYDTSQPTDTASSQICEGLLVVGDELPAHLDSCLTSLTEYKWEPSDLEALGLQRPEEKSWFSYAFNSIFLYAHTSSKHNSHIDRLAINLNEGMLLRLFETTRFREDCESYILLRLGRDSPHDFKTPIKKARDQWQRNRGGARTTFGDFFAIFLHQWWLIHKGELELFGEGLPSLLKRAEDFMRQNLIDISRQTSSVGVWPWIKSWRHRASPFENSPTLVEFGLYLTVDIIYILFNSLVQIPNTIKLVTPIIEWLEGFWLPQSFQTHLRIYENDKRVLPMFNCGLVLLGYMQWRLKRIDDLPNTFNVFDNLTASYGWLLALGLSTDVFLSLKTCVYREREDWENAITYLREYIQYLEKARPKSHDMQCAKFNLAKYCLQMDGYETHADEIMSEFSASAMVHDQQLWRRYVRTKKFISRIYCRKGFCEKAYKLSSQFLQEVLSNSTSADEDILHAEIATAYTLIFVLRKKLSLPGNRQVPTEHLTSLKCVTASLFDRWKSFALDTRLLALIVKYYLTQELWGDARWILMQYLRIVGNRCCTFKDCDLKSQHSESYHFLLELNSFDLRVVDSYPAREYRTLLESAYAIFKDASSEQVFAGYCDSMMRWDIYEGKYRRAEIYHDWYRAWLVTRKMPYEEEMRDPRVACGMAIKLMLGKWRDAYELFLEDIHRYPNDECSEEFNQTCLSLIPTLPRPTAMTDREIRYIEIVLISWLLIIYLLNEDWTDDSFPKVCTIAQNIMEYVVKRACDCFICHTVLSSTLAYVYYKAKDKRKAGYWIQQSITEFRKLQSLGREQIPDDHLPIYQLVDYELKWAFEIEGWIDEMEQEETTQDQDSSYSSGDRIATLWDPQRDRSSIWEQAVYSVSSFLCKLQPTRFELLGVVLLTSGVLGGSAFRMLSVHGNRRQGLYGSRFLGLPLINWLRVGIYGRNAILAAEEIG